MMTSWAMAQSKLKKRLYSGLVLTPALPAGLVLHFATDWERSRSTAPLRARAAPSVVIPLSMDTAAIRDVAEGVGDDDGGGSPDAIFVGRIHPGKGLEHLIPAWKELASSTARLLVIGNHMTPLGERLKAEAQHDTDRGRIEWAGPVYPPKLYGQVSRSRCLVLPSDHENFGLVAVEAIACGTPALVSDEVAVGRPLIEAGVARSVSRVPHLLAGQLAELLSGHQRGEAGSLPCREDCFRVAQTFDHAAVGLRWRDTYSSLHRS